MTTTGTITSKRQLTIPAQMFGELGLSKGDKVIIESTDGGLVIRKAKEVIRQVSGSVEVPDHLRKVDLDSAIKQAKKVRFTAET